MALGLLPLLYFKYFGFFRQEIASFLGIGGGPTLDLLLPIGISFFTFRLISYAIEIKRGTIDPLVSVVDFAVYIAFFPTLMAGPIDRPQHFLPQLAKRREVDYEDFVTGLKRLAWGCFLKVCIADQLMLYIDAAYNGYATLPGTTLLTAALLYPLQLYADFAGYSHMAIGLSRMLGFRVAENFNRPFFAQNVAEYWRRWHMSLTSWLTDYVFLPLNIRLRDMERWGTVVACTLNFVLVGFWHGANWTFGAFGLYHALLFLPLILRGRMNKRRKAEWRHGVIAPATALRMTGVYLLVALGLVMFRSNSMTDCMLYLGRMVSSVGFADMPDYIDNSLTAGLIFMTAMIANDFLEEKNGGKNGGNGLLQASRPWAVVATVSLLLALVLLFGSSATQVFIYQRF